jgi:hypothetical protein
MANRTLKAEAKKSRDGSHQVTVHSQDTDAPILPVAQLQTLHQFRPDLVDFVVEQTKIESTHRREQEAKINSYIFWERMAGHLTAIVLAILGVGGAAYLGLNGQPWLGGVIATSTIGTLAVSVYRRQAKSDKSP